jgi:hypothetical protein
MPIYHLSEADNGDIKEWAEKNSLSYSVYTNSHGFVVVAASEQEARKLAAEADDRYGNDAATWWLEPTLTKCEELHDGDPRVVLGDWPTG